MSTVKFPNTVAKQSESMQQYGLSKTKNKTENLFTDFSHSKNCSSFLITPCARCQQQESSFQCVECRSIKLCPTCNNQLHQFGKFLYHQRVLLSQVNQFQNSSLTELTTPRKIKSGEIISHQLRIKKAKINISQTWNNIISQLSLKFQEIFNLLENKKRELVHKLQSKRDNEIYLYEQAVNGLQNGQQKERKLKKNIIQRNQDFHIRIKAMEIESIQRKFNKEYKFASPPFQDILNFVSKIQIKNVLFKVSEQIGTHTTKKSMKGSLIVGNYNTSSALSPNTKALTSQKSPLSLSTIQGTEKSNNQQSSSKMIGLYYGKETKGLSLVRSEKLFCKSPSNSTKIIKQFTKNKKQL